MIESSPHLTHTPQPPIKTAKKVRPLKVLLTIGVLLLILGTAVMTFLYYQTRQELLQLSTPQGQQRLSEQEMTAVLEQLGKLTLLPDEEPVMATIIDAAYLATQSAFYEQSENGDKLVVFPKAKKAIIYSPSRNIIVNSGPVIDDQVSSALRVELRNGTADDDILNEIKTGLEANGATVTAMSPAANRNYAQTRIIGTSDKVTDETLAALATYLDGQVIVTLPVSEKESDADVLVIVGSSTGNASATPEATPTP